MVVNRPVTGYRHLVDQSAREYAVLYNTGRRDDDAEVRASQGFQVMGFR